MNKLKELFIKLVAIAFPSEQHGSETDNLTDQEKADYIFFGLFVLFIFTCYGLMEKYF